MSDIAASENKVQQESVQFDQPVSEASATSMGALANFLREVIMPVGTVLYSMLDEATFQAQTTSPSPARWIIADGRSVAGSTYESLTGNSTAPDLRGVFIRGKNGARSGATGNPDGDLALGTYSADKFKSHDHSFSDPGHAHTTTSRDLSGSSPDRNTVGPPFNTSFPTGITSTNVTNINFVASGGNETAPRDVTMNPFIRIN